MADSSEVTTGVNSFPRQKISDKKKGDKWHKRNIEAGIDLINKTHGDSIRLSSEEKYVNIGLVDDILDPRDMSKVFNQTGSQAIADAYADIKNYPIEAKYFNLLIGEGSQRSFDYDVMITNPEVNNSKNQKKAKIIYDYVKQMIQSESFSQSEVEQKITELDNHLKYNYRDLREVRASQLLKHIVKLTNLKEKFITTHNDLNTQAEEIMGFESFGGQLNIDPIKPVDLFTVRSGDSKYIQDSDIIVHRTYMSPYQIIDRFKDDLSNSDKNKIDRSYSDDFDGDSDGGKVLMGIVEVDENGNEFTGIGNGAYIDLDDPETGGIGEPINRHGDLRVVRVCWKSFREVGVLSTEDDEGNVSQELVDSEYEVNSEIGETLEKIWISEWREGYKIGSDIYAKFGPWFGNVYSKEDLRLTTSPFIGYIYTISGQKAIAPMSQIKNLKYLYNIIREEEGRAIGRNIGNVLEVDLASMPTESDGWGFDKIMSLMKLTNVQLVDSFQNLPEDPNVRAGNYNTTGKVKDLSQVNHIQLYDQILESIKNEIGEILGITPQRLGSVNNRETVGGIERSVVQSSNTTEPWFKARDFFKKMVLTNAMELGKLIYDGSSVTVENIIGDDVQGFINVDGTQYAEYDYSLFISDPQENTEIKQAIKGVAPMMLQADKISASDYLVLMGNADLPSMKRIIKQSELDKANRDKQVQEQQSQLAQQQVEATAREEQLKRDFEMAKLDKEINSNILIKEMDVDNKLDVQELKNEDSDRNDDQEVQHKMSIEERKLQLQADSQRIQEKYQREDLNLKRDKQATDRMKVNQSNNNK